MNAWNALLHLLSLAATNYEKWQERRQNKKRQADRDELENDVGVWFVDHFDGLSDDTDKTDKTDATDSKPDRRK